MLHCTIIQMLYYDKTKWYDFDQCFYAVYALTHKQNPLAAITYYIIFSDCQTIDWNKRG